MSQPPIGIDLGTTNSLIAAFVDEQKTAFNNVLSEKLGTDKPIRLKAQAWAVKLQT
jgi:molecular chaperone DnaK (HSP70)